RPVDHLSHYRLPFSPPKRQMNAPTMTRAASRSFEDSLFTIPVPTAIIGGMRISVVDRQTAAQLMIMAVHEHQWRGRRALYFTSANGEVIARANADPDIATLFAGADQILADGQPLVAAS